MRSSANILLKLLVNNKKSELKKKTSFAGFTLRKEDFKNLIRNDFAQNSFLFNFKVFYILRNEKSNTKKR
jgi:hypothetical protein